MGSLLEGKRIIPGCMNTGHLILASHLCWLLHKTPRKPKKHTGLGLHSSVSPLFQPILAGFHIPPQTQQMSDHDNFIFSRYPVFLKHVFCLTITIDNYLIFRNFYFKARACFAPYQDLPSSDANTRTVKKNKNVIHANC